MANTALTWEQSVAALSTPRPGFLMAEETAIKRRLSTISVGDDRNSERVCQVFFRYPERETEDVYPFFTIDLLDIQHDTDVQISETDYYYTTDTSGMTADQLSRFSEFNYYPSTLGPTAMTALAADGGFITTESFVPVRLIYQISSYTRNALHDIQITAKMLRRVTPFRRGFLEVPEDGTIRRFDMLNWSNTNVLDQEAAYNKRIYRKNYTLSMSAEIPAADLSSTKQVLSVHGALSLENRYDLTVNTNPYLTEAF